MINVVTAPTEYPVSLADVKAALLIDHNQDDAFLATLIAAATEEAEGLAARSFCTRTIDLIVDAWPAGGTILLEYPPVQSVLSIIYYDENNAASVMPATDYISVLDGAPAVMLAKNASWPSATLRSVAPIRVRYVAGYGTAAAVPGRYRSLILGLIAVDYENREALSPQGVVQRERLQAALKMDWGWAT